MAKKRKVGFATSDLYTSAGKARKKKYLSLMTSEPYVRLKGKQQERTRLFPEKEGLKKVPYWKNYLTLDLKT